MQMKTLDYLMLLNNRLGMPQNMADHGEVLSPKSLRKKELSVVSFIPTLRMMDIFKDKSESFNFPKTHFGFPVFGMWCHSLSSYWIRKPFPGTHITSYNFV